MSKPRKGKGKGGTSFGHLLLSSSVILYFVLAITLLTLWSLWTEQDNESLFLFIIMAYVVYMKQKNMIYVLGIPFIAVNGLVHLRTLFRKQTGEGFINYETYDPFEFQTWMLNYVDNDEKYEVFSEEISDDDGNNLGSFSQLFTDMRVNAMKSASSDSQYVERFKDYLVYVQSITPSNKAMFKNDQVVYVRKMIELYTQDCNQNDGSFQYQKLIKEFVEGQSDSYEGKTHNDFDEDVVDVKGKSIGNLKEYVQNVIDNPFQLTDDNPNKEHVKKLREFLLKVTDKDVVIDVDEELVTYAGDMKNYIARKME